LRSDFKDIADLRPSGTEALRELSARRAYYKNWLRLVLLGQEFIAFSLEIMPDNPSGPDGFMSNWKKLGVAYQFE